MLKKCYKNLGKIGILINLGKKALVTNLFSAKIKLQRTYNAKNQYVTKLQNFPVFFSAEGCSNFLFLKFFFAAFLCRNLCNSEKNRIFAESLSYAKIVNLS